MRGSQPLSLIRAPYDPEEDRYNYDIKLGQLAKTPSAA